MELLILSVLSVFQSIFGVGVLLFGTPIFLVLGYSFVEVLVLLLPISMTISLVTVVTGRALRWKPTHIGLLAFPIMLGTVVAVDRDANLLILLVGLVMVISALANHFIRNSRKKLKIMSNKIAIPLIGSVHGLTNQGGGLLLMWASTANDSAEDIRSTVAFFYGIMALLQLTTVGFLYPDYVVSELDFGNLLIPIAAFALGAIIFSGLDKVRFKVYVNIVVLIFGVIVLFKGFDGVIFGY
ncbi:hypothetical protein N9D43_02925 [Luminiphilus sp.]|nr:hypothetical protein [Luminiphilus sp.]